MKSVILLFCARKWIEHVTSNRVVLKWSPSFLICLIIITVTNLSLKLTWPIRPLPEGGLLWFHHFFFFFLFLFLFSFSFSRYRSVPEKSALKIQWQRTLTPYEEVCLVSKVSILRIIWRIFWLVFFPIGVSGRRGRQLLLAKVRMPLAGLIYLNWKFYWRYKMLQKPNMTGSWLFCGYEGRIKGVLCSFILPDLCQILPGDGICTSRISIQRGIILVVHLYDMLYWCKTIAGLYHGYLKTTQNSLKSQWIASARL